MDLAVKTCKHNIKLQHLRRPGQEPAVEIYHAEKSQQLPSSAWESSPPPPHGPAAGPPRNSMLLAPNMHFSALITRPCSLRHVKSLAAPLAACLDHVDRRAVVLLLDGVHRCHGPRLLVAVEGEQSLRPGCQLSDVCLVICL